MSPRHISTQEARKRIENAKQQLLEGIRNKAVPDDQIEYLEWVLERGVKNCEKSEELFDAKGDE